MANPHNPNTAPQPMPPADPAEVVKVLHLAGEAPRNPASFGQLVRGMRANQPTHYAAAQQCEALNLNPATKGQAEHSTLQAAFDPSLKVLPNGGNSIEAPQGLFSLNDYHKERKAPEPAVVTDIDKYVHDLAVLGGNMNELANHKLSGDPQEANVIKQMYTEQEQSAQIVLDRLNATLAKYPDYSSFAVSKIQSLRDSLAKSSGKPLDSSREAAKAANQRVTSTNEWDTWTRGRTGDMRTQARQGLSEKAIELLDAEEAQPHYNPAVAQRNAAKANVANWRAQENLTDAENHASADKNRSDFLQDIVDNGALKLDLGLSDADARALENKIDVFANEYNTASANTDPALAHHGTFDNKWGLRGYAQRLDAEIQSLSPRSPRRRDLIVLLNKALLVNRQMAHYEAKTRLESGTVAKPGDTGGDGRIYVERVDPQNDGILIGDGSNIVVYPNGDMAHVTPGSTTPGPRLASYRNTAPAKVPSIDPAHTQHSKWNTKKFGLEPHQPLPYAEANTYHRRGGRIIRAVGSLAAGLAAGGAYELFDGDVNNWRPLAAGVATAAVVGFQQVRSDRKAQRKQEAIPKQQRYAKST